MTNVQEKMSNVQGQVVSAVDRTVESAKEAAHTVGSKVSDFFQGNPFETPVGRKIGKLKLLMLGIELFRACN